MLVWSSVLSQRLALTEETAATTLLLRTRQTLIEHAPITLFVS
jgi:hypothetical protein